MIKKALILLFSFCFFSCRNPFVTYIEPQDGNIYEIEKDSENISDDVKTAAVQITLSMPFTDINISTSRIGQSVELSVNGEYEIYQWIMNEQVIGREKTCVINLENFPTDLYTVELYAVKNGMIYSGLTYITRNDNNLSITTERSIMPSISRVELQNLELCVLNTADGREELFNFDSGAQLEKEKLFFTNGTYSFTVKTKKGNLEFIGNTEVELKTGSNKIQLPLVLQSGSQVPGSFFITAIFPEEVSVDDATVKFYKKLSDTFLLIEEKKLSSGTLKLQEKENSYIECLCQNLPAGIYYVDIETYSQNYKKQADYKSYVYILPETQSSKTVRISHFINLYTINYKLNGGFFLGKTLQNKVNALDTLILPQEEQLYLPGRSFKGWFTDDTFTTPALEVYEPGEISEDRVFFALWEENTARSDVICGEGLLSGRRCKVWQEGRELVILMPLEQSASYCFIDVYDSIGKQCAVENQSVTVENNAAQARLEINLIPEKDYMIEIKTAKNTKMNDIDCLVECLWEKQIIRALSH